MATSLDPSFRHNDSRIDILCVCDKLKPRVESCDHVINPCPDHKAVILSVRGEEKQIGKGYWKLNVSILNEESYKETTCKIIQDTICRVIPCQLIHFFADPSPILMKFGKLGGQQKKLIHTKFQHISTIFNGVRAL